MQETRQKDGGRGDSPGEGHGTARGNGGIEEERGKELHRFILCYVDKPWAYFTTQTLEEQTGDDWNDAPYQHNAGKPYSPCWHNAPEMRNDPHVKRGYKRGTKTPLGVGELCRCSSCVWDWNEDATPRWEILKVDFDGPFKTVEQFSLHSYSVEKINSKSIPWLLCEDRGLSIFAGTTFPDFCKEIEKSGGHVYRIGSESKEGQE